MVHGHRVLDRAGKEILWSREEIIFSISSIIFGILFYKPKPVLLNGQQEICLYVMLATNLLFTGEPSNLIANYDIAIRLDRFYCARSEEVQVRLCVETIFEVTSVSPRTAR